MPRARFEFFAEANKQSLRHTNHALITKVFFWIEKRIETLKKNKTIKLSRKDFFNERQSVFENELVKKQNSICVRLRIHKTTQGFIWIFLWRMGHISKELNYAGRKMKCLKTYKAWNERTTIWLDAPVACVQRRACTPKRFVKIKFEFYANFLLAFGSFARKAACAPVVKSSFSFLVKQLPPNLNSYVFWTMKTIDIHWLSAVSLLLQGFQEIEVLSPAFRLLRLKQKQAKACTQNFLFLRGLVANKPATKPRSQTGGVN